MGFQVLTLRPSQRQQLQRIAERLAAAKQLLAEGEQQEDAIKVDCFKLFDELAGAGSHLIFEALDPFASWRMVREISEPRSFDVDGLKRDLTPAQFRRITKVSVDTKALDVELERGGVDAAVVEQHTSRRTQERGPLWKPSAGDIHLRPGELAVIHG